MMLYIAEKPSLGRAIADALPGPHKHENGYIRVGNGDCVSWCIGHLLEQAEPDTYNPVYKKWLLEHLPIIPQQWQLHPKASTQKQLSILKKLIKQADCLVHAGDPDREGQLLVDEVINYAKTSKNKQQNTKRCLINDLNPVAVKTALSRLRDNKEFIPLSVSALARARADWLYGINMTRVYTIQGRKAGYNGVLSVGRVQTPILGLVVTRDKSIDSFVSKPFYEVLALLKTRHDQQFKAKWQPSEACSPYMDEEGRVLSKALAQNVVERITNKPGTITAVVKKRKKEAPPLPYNLSALQIDGAKQFAMNAKQVLDLCQGLYEKHQLITYPRSDCRYLPKEHFKQSPDIINTIKNNCPELQKAADNANNQQQSKAWNDSKVDAHHAIIPTLKRTGFKHLGSQEQQIYQLICRQYLAQFYPVHQYDESRVTVDIEGGTFIAKAKQIIEPGWKILFPGKKTSNSPDGTSKDIRPADRMNPKQQDGDNTLPVLTKGETVHCIEGQLQEKQTQAPKPFNDASLLSAMTGIARFVTDPDIRKTLKETDGLGTEATRAGILELLFKRGFLCRQGKQIHATTAGRALIESLPESAVTPDMTALWESVLSAISEGKSRYEEFILPLEHSLRQLIKAASSTVPTGLSGIKPTKSAIRKKRKKRLKQAKSTHSYP